jgi:LCP family protein required for cell wall assembly
MTRKGAKPSRPRKRGWKWGLASALLVVFVAGGAYCGYLFYSTIKDFVAHAQLGSMPAQPNVEQGRAPQEELPNLSRERVNILLLGTDRRSGEVGPSRTDTMIVVTVDPQNKTAAMLSIPRDLWVPIPGHSENRINTAHFLGDRDKYPGGGPALAKKTVQYTLGVPIHYYVRVNFEGFERAIDLIGGIVIDVKEPILDTKFPDDNYGFITVDIPAGIQRMDGKTALQYARSRHGSTDFARARRQQEVIKAVRDKILSLDIPLTRIPEMLRVVGDSVQTDLSLSEMYTLAKLARDIPMEQISSAVIDESMTTPQTTPDGAQVLIPNRDRIRELVNELFGGPTPTGTASLSEKELLAQESAKVEVQNGTLTPGLAQRTADLLKGLGYDVPSFSNADRSDYALTVIIDYTGKANTVGLLAQRFGVSTENVRRQTGVQSNVDVRLILGRDYTASPTQ